MANKKIHELPASGGIQDAHKGIVSEGTGSGDVKYFTWSQVKAWIQGLALTFSQLITFNGPILFKRARSAWHAAGSGTAFAPDASEGQNQKYTFTNDGTVSVPANLDDGGSMVLMIAGNGFSATFAAGYVFPETGNPLTKTLASKHTLFQVIREGSDYLIMELKWEV